MTGICWFDGQTRVDEISDTPRTDAFLENALSAIHETETLEDFTRQLERELAAERERADRAHEGAERYQWLRMNRLWLKANLPMIHAGAFDAAIDAARRK